MGINSSKTIYFFGETPILGASHIPLMRTQFVDPQINALSDYDYLIVTSKRSIMALEYFFYDLKGLELFCVGGKTAEYAKSRALKVKYVAQGYAKDLISDILPFIEGKRGLYLRPKTVANPYISDYVKKGLLEEVVCYETLCIEKSEERLLQPAVLLFAAPSQIACFQKHYTFNKDDLAVVIGDTTAKALPKGVQCKISSVQSLKALQALAQAHIQGDTFKV